jgi:uncharacterized protein YecE (DUF72 family)
MATKFLRVGCCGWQKSHAAYFQNFDILEVDSTFYRLPQLKTALRWRDEAPPGFVYTLKAWQVITHEPYSPTYARGRLNIPGPQWKRYGSFRPSDEVHSAWEQTIEIAHALGSPVVVFQCPNQFNPTPEHLNNLRSFFSSVERGGLLFAWEPRGSDWKTELVHDLCRELNLIHCLDPFLGIPAYGSPRYFRLHGSLDYTYQFSDADLELLKDWVEQGDTYCLFNNTHMWEDSTRFKRLMGLQPA